jgi:hypothetical protein
VYVDRWFASPKIFNHLWGCKTKAVGTVMSNRNEGPKQAFSGELKKGKKISCQRDHLLVIQWKDIHDLFFLTTAHDIYLLRHHCQGGENHKIKPAAVLDYKYSVERSD